MDIEDLKEEISCLHFPASSLLLRQSLQLCFLSGAQLEELSLLLLEGGDLFLLQNFDHGLLDGFAHQHLQDRLNFDIEIEQLKVNAV